VHRDEKTFRTILVSSAEPLTGKTTVALNLAIAAADTRSKRVLLIDGDLRKPSLHQLMSRSMMDSLNVPKTRLGYCALTNLGYSREKPPTEFANPQGLGRHGMPMDEYLDRHYDFGATLVVINIGATSDTMMSRLRDAVWNKEAITAYQRFLDGR
jgi:hypothetical protein